MLEKHRGKLEDLEFDPSKSVEYDEEFARIGKEEKEGEEREQGEGKEEENKGEKEEEEREEVKKEGNKK